MPRDKNIFTLNPTSLDMKRSVFPRNSQLKTSFDMGKIIPIYLDEILPGDTVSLDLASVTRMGTPIAPIMDNLYMDVYFFFVPNRIVWSHWQQFCGENDTTAWTEAGNYTIPVQDIGSEFPDLIDDIHSIGAYFGLPMKPSVYASGAGNTGVAESCEVSELPLRAYAKIYNDWFRNENVTDPVLFTIGDSTNTNISYNDGCYKANRFHDLFSSALPAPQKGASVELPLGTTAPLDIGEVYKMRTASSSQGAYFGDHTKPNGIYDLYSISDSDGPVYEMVGKTSSSGIGDIAAHMDSTNLYADLSRATAATVNQLRVAFQVQKLLEKDARGGTRYIELLRAHFGVTSPDARLQRSEYLCGQRFRINVDQVLATADSGGSGSSIVGQTGAVSKTTHAGSMFTKSFVEHGMLIGVCVVRQDHTYSQGLDRYWLKSSRFDFYYPVLANIGEVPLFKSEIMVDKTEGVGEASGVFGYQEPWFEYRFKPSKSTALLNPAVNGSLNYWTLGDVYSSVPGLNDSFVEEGSSFLTRALAAGSSTDQFIADFYFKAKYSRVMPVYSIPGLIDHH